MTSSRAKAWLRSGSNSKTISSLIFAALVLASSTPDLMAFWRLTFKANFDDGKKLNLFCSSVIMLASSRTKAMASAKSTVDQMRSNWVRSSCNSWALLFLNSIWPLRAASYRLNTFWYLSMVAAIMLVESVLAIWDFNNSASGVEAITFVKITFARWSK